MMKNFVRRKIWLMFLKKTNDDKFLFAREIECYIWDSNLKSPLLLEYTSTYLFSLSLHPIPESEPSYLDP